MTTTRLSWERSGSGHPLVLLHGIGTTRDDFSSLRTALEDRYEVLAVDLPGHGDSLPLDKRPTVRALAEAIEADLDALGVGRVHVLGDSLGARIAIELARRDRALSVVAIAPSGLNLLPERIYQGAAMGAARLIMKGLRPFIDTMAGTAGGRTVLLTGLRSRPWNAAAIDGRALKRGFAEADGYWSLLFWGILADLPTGLENVHCPVLLAQGTADLISSAQTPRYLLAIPGSTFHPLIGAGHAPQSDAPDAILRLVDMATRLAQSATAPTPSMS